jgi:uncharacterized protein
MNISSIYINLPVQDITKTREFWTKLGFQFNEQFSDDQALCLSLNEGSIYVMFIVHGKFATFTNRKIADQSTTQALFAIQVDTREQVDTIVQTALENGAISYKESVDQGWMYYSSFADLDGHQWEIMFADMSQLTIQE